MKDSAKILSIALLSLSVLACGSDKEDSTRSLNALNELKTKVSSLDQSCGSDSECTIVTDDFACKKSYVSIAKSALSEYLKLEKKSEAFTKTTACTMEYSPRYDQKNYNVFCSATNFCSLEYIEPSLP